MTSLRPDPPSEVPRGTALGWMLFLGPLFFLVYVACNWLTGERADVGTFYFGWETRIPFIPVLIVPYMTIDLFFAGSTFLCRSRAELSALVRRILFAILVSAAGFLLFPLRFAFSRPEVSGPLGALFTLLTSFDRPYNLAPSLHISLLSVIWPLYRRRTAGLLRTALDGWFVLVGLSTLFTYQHHTMDVLSGAMVGLLCFYLFPEEVHPSRVPANTNLRVGSRYAVLSLAALLVVRAGWPWTLPLAWPAVSLGIMALAYAGLGPVVFRKSRGRLPPSAGILLAPYLIGTWLSFRHYRRLGPAWCEVAPGLLMGRRLSEAEAEEALRQRRVAAVLDLTAEYGETASFLRLPYKNVPVLDLTPPTSADLEEAIQFIREHRRLGPVYVHCALGYSRSACAIAAYLLADGLAATVEEAVERLRGARPQIVLTPVALSLLRAHHARGSPSGSPPPRPVRGGAAVRAIAELVAAAARILTGARVRWVGCRPEARQRVYFANHSSHLDFLVLWAAMPRGLRGLTRPVAAKDYWGSGSLRRTLVTSLFNAVLIERLNLDAVGRREQLDVMLEALGCRHSLIVFPEGTRGGGEAIAPFKSGLYHLALKRPDVELVPVLLENLHRILPKGALFPVPLLSRVAFGAPIALLAGEGKDAFLERAREAVLALGTA